MNLDNPADQPPKRRLAWGAIAIIAAVAVVCLVCEAFTLVPRVGP